MMLKGGKGFKQCDGGELGQTGQANTQQLSAVLSMGKPG